MGFIVFLTVVLTAGYTPHFVGTVGPGKWSADVREAP